MEALAHAQTAWQRAARLRQGIRDYPLVIVAVAFGLWQVVIPLGVLLVFSFRSGTAIEPGDWTLEHYITSYSHPDAYTMFANTVGIALAATLLSLLLAAMLAFLTERTDMPFRNVGWALVILPLAVPGLPFAMAWTILLGPNVGLLNVWLREGLSLFGMQLTQGPFNIYSLGGIIFLEALRGTTTLFLMIAASFRALDPALEDSAHMSGANFFQALTRVTIPLLTPALLAAFIYGFMGNLESLEIPMVAGLPARIYVFSSYIYFSTIRVFPPTYGIGAALGVTFILASLALVFWYRRVALQAGRFATITGKGYRPRLIRLGRWRYLAVALFFGYFLLTVVLPGLMLVWQSLLKFYMAPSIEALSRVTLANYAAVFELSHVLNALRNTLIVGLATATLTMLVGIVIAWAVVRTTVPGRDLLDGLAFLPNALPGVVIALSLIFLYLRPPLVYLPIYGTVVIVVLGLVTSYLPFATRLMNGAVAQVHQELEDAAHASGASWSQLLGRILLPLLFPAVISGWVWVAAHALRSFSIPVILATQGNEVLSVSLWMLWSRGYIGQAAALGMVFIVALGVLTLAGRLLVSRTSLQE